jgi:hypothetical protein
MCHGDRMGTAAATGGWDGRTMVEDGRAGRGGALAMAVGRTGLTTRELWIRYLALGGNADEVSLDAELHGLIPLPPGEYNVLAHAVNEALDDLPASARGPRVAYLHPSSDQARRAR